MSREPAPTRLHPPPTGPVTYFEALKLVALDSQACAGWIEFYAAEPDVAALAAHWRRRQAGYDQICRILDLIITSPDLKAHVAEEIRAQNKREAQAAEAAVADDAGERGAGA